MWFFCTNPIDRMLDNPFVLYKTVFGYPGRSPILCVYVTPEFQWTCKYCTSVLSLMFYRYLKFAKSLRFNCLSRFHQFSSIPASSAASRIVSPTCIILELCFSCGDYFWYSSVMESICKATCDEV